MIFLLVFFGRICEKVSAMFALIVLSNISTSEFKCPKTTSKLNSDIHFLGICNFVCFHPPGPVSVQEGNILKQKDVYLNGKVNVIVLGFLRSRSYSRT